MASTIIQLYLKDVLEVFFNTNGAVRIAASNVVMLTLQQGLVHPVQVVFLMFDCYLLFVFNRF